MDAADDPSRKRRSSAETSKTASNKKANSTGAKAAFSSLPLDKSKLSPLKIFLVKYPDIFREKLAPFLWIPDMYVLGEVARQVSTRTPGILESLRSVKWPCYKCPHEIPNVLRNV
ncbi:MAG: hypothetical protein SGARI_003792, partial [Bacillariaceae sp.]